MSRLQSSLFLIVLLGSGCCTLAEAPKETVPGSAFVLFRPSLLGDAILATRRAEFLGRGVKSIVASPNATVTQFTIGSAQAVFVSQASESELSELKKKAESLQGVMEPNYVYSVHQPALEKVGSTWPVPALLSPPPSDTCSRRRLQSFYNEHLDLLDLRPNDTYYCGPAKSGAPMDVFVLDTGIDSTHKEFAGIQILLDDADDHSGRGKWTPLQDTDGHGTHVAGIIGSASFGVTPNVVFHSVKVLSDSGNGTAHSILNGLDIVQRWLQSNPSKKAIITMSFSGPRHATVEAKLAFISRTLGDRAVLIAAAGNENHDACEDNVASVDDVITVGSVTGTLLKSKFSNHGKCVDVFAYGDNVQSTSPRNRFVVSPGTSAAASVVTGVIAQYWLQNPGKSGFAIRSMLLDQSESDLHAQGKISGLPSGTANKLIRYTCPGGCGTTAARAYPYSCLTYPCLNGGYCWNTWSSYTCICPNGITGDQCERISYPACSSGPCRNSGICTNTYDGYQCNCVANYRGYNCGEYSYSACAYSPCLNGGWCYDQGASYVCSCKAGYQGSRCEYASGCALSPCRNGGYCSSSSSSNSYNGYSCYCVNGYTGTNCENYPNTCYPNPCANGGVCRTSGYSYYCSCPYGFSGDRCQSYDTCYGVSCQNGGICYSGTCQCAFGYSGTRCERSNKCAYGNYCLNGGTCYDSGYNAACSCPPRFSGEFCQKQCYQYYGNICYSWY